MDFELSPTCQIKNLKEIYERFFSEERDRIFVEVGASDGYSHSNTWGLAKAGWRGLYFEPVPELANKCSFNHKDNDVIVKNIAIGNKVGVTKLYLGSSPTINEETVDKNPWDFTYDKNNFIMVPVSTLNRELDNLLLYTTVIDLLVIDVEGAELEVLEGLDFLTYIPEMIIIESCEGNPEVKKTFHTQQILKYFENLPYTKIQSDGINSIFINTPYLEN